MRSKNRIQTGRDSLVVMGMKPSLCEGRFDPSLNANRVRIRCGIGTLLECKLSNYGFPGGAPSPGGGAIGAPFADGFAPSKGGAGAPGGFTPSGCFGALSIVGNWAELCRAFTCLSYSMPSMCQMNP
jgi:hypothetical protein